MIRRNGLSEEKSADRLTPFISEHSANWKTFSIQPRPFFCIRVKNSDTRLVTVSEVFLLEGFSSSVLETETSQCLAATRNSHLRDAIEIPPHFCVGIYEMLNILYPELYTCYTSVYSFNSPTENGNYTLLKDIQDNQ